MPPKKQPQQVANKKTVEKKKEKVIEVSKKMPFSQRCALNRISTWPLMSGLPYIIMGSLEGPVFASCSV